VKKSKIHSLKDGKLPEDGNSFASKAGLQEKKDGFLF